MVCIFLQVTCHIKMHTSVKLSTLSFFLTLSYYFCDFFDMAGAVGFEPTIHDTKNRCLTTWLRPINYL